MSGCLMILSGSTPSIHLEDVELGFLNIDAYADTAWTHERLSTLTAHLRERRDHLRASAEQGILATHRRHALEPWMVSLVDRALSATAEHTTLERILVLAEAAEQSSATLAFVAD